MKSVVEAVCVVLALGVWVCVGLASSTEADGNDQRAPLAIENVSEYGALLLAGGGRLCLDGIGAPAVVGRQDRPLAWRSAWRRIIERDRFFYEPKERSDRDRYGCRMAPVHDADGQTLQHALLTAGWAIVNPTSASPVSMSNRSDAIEAMLALEAEARRAKRGVWKDRDAWPRKADDLTGQIGQRLLVEGRVQRVFTNDRYVYLNFGADWRTDFTARLDRKMIERSAFDAADFDGKSLRLRGVLEESRGPLMNISHLKQIEFLP